MHAANRVLILPLEQLTESERADIHMANEYHWRAEPGKVAGRPLMDCPNAQPGITPLNTETTKQLDIARYQPVVLPNLREVVRRGMNIDAPEQLNGATCGCSKQTSPIASLADIYTGTPPPY